MTPSFLQEYSHSRGHGLLEVESNPEAKADVSCIVEMHAEAERGLECLPLSAIKARLTI